MKFNFWEERELQNTFFGPFSNIHTLPLLQVWQLKTTNEKPITLDFEILSLENLIYIWNDDDRDEGSSLNYIIMKKQGS